MISPDQLSSFFAYAPLVLFTAIVAVAYAGKRHEGHDATAPISQTLACGACGGSYAREHMVPKRAEGGIAWYCEKCAGRA